MGSKKVIQVFEYQKIRIGYQQGETTFDAVHLQALSKYNELHANKYFTLINRGIQFNQYVGVIQIGDLTLEILPKADRAKEPSKSKWQGVLFDMLKACKLLKVDSISDARLRLRNSSILDIYIDSFLSEVEEIAHKGLVKKYSKRRSNQLALKGSLQFQKHVTTNLIHKERFYVEHQVYNAEHLLHQILNEALMVIPSISNNSNFSDRIKRIKLSFPELKRLKVGEEHFKRIRLNRKTTHYQPSLAIARMLLLNYSPDIKGGRQNVLALLFDMNVLFEEYVFQQLRKLDSIKVMRQQSKLFWEQKRIRPDIVLVKDDVTYVLDTKWKVLNTATPSDADLKQMYVYNQYWSAPKTVLVYPQVFGLENRRGHFQLTHTLDHDSSLACDLVFVDVLDINGNLNVGLGDELVGVLG